jgi:hypothetical protein
MSDQYENSCVNVSAMTIGPKTTCQITVGKNLQMSDQYGNSCVNVSAIYNRSKDNLPNDSWQKYANEHKGLIEERS